MVIFKRASTATQQNAALVEQAAAAAMSLVEQANALSDVVAVFKLDNNASGSKSKVRQPLRLAAASNASVKPAAKPVAKIASAKVDEGDWEEF